MIRAAFLDLLAAVVATTSSMTGSVAGEGVTATFPRSASGNPNGMPVVSVDARAPTHVVNPLFMGCHSDSGFAHTCVPPISDSQQILWPQSGW